MAASNALMLLNLTSSSMKYVDIASSSVEDAAKTFMVNLTSHLWSNASKDFGGLSSL